VIATTSAKRQAEIVVFSVLKPSVCSSCGAEIGKGALLRMEKQRPLCLACADLDHLAYLPAGDAALSRRSRKHSTLSAVVVRSAARASGTDVTVQAVLEQWTSEADDFTADRGDR